MDLTHETKTVSQFFEDGYESGTLLIAENGVLFTKNYVANRIAWARKNGWSSPAHDAYWHGFSRAVEDRETP